MAKRSIGASVYLTLIGVMLAMAGGVFTWLMSRSYLRANEVAGWPEVPCQILQAELEERQANELLPVEYRVRVLYGYEWNGERMTGDRWKLRGSPWSNKREVVEKDLEGFVAGSQSVCRVNPEHPEIAVLEGESRGPGYSLWFPMLFVVGGLGVVIGAWRKE